MNLNTFYNSKWVDHYSEEKRVEEKEMGILFENFSRSLRMELELWTGDRESKVAHLKRRIQNYVSPWQKSLAEKYAVAILDKTEKTFGEEHDFFVQQLEQNLVKVISINLLSGRNKPGSVLKMLSSMGAPMGMSVGEVVTTLGCEVHFFEYGQPLHPGHRLNA